MDYYSPIPMCTVRLFLSAIGQGIVSVQIANIMNNRENELNLIISEPPLKKFKKQIEENLESSSEIIPKVIFSVDTSFVISDPVDSPKESTLEKWRKSFQSSSLVSNQQIDLEIEMKEIELLSDGFFSDPPVKEETEFEFEFEGISEIDQEMLFEQSSRYESVRSKTKMYLLIFIFV